MGKSFESVGAMWSVTDEHFFRFTADLFRPEFLWGAGALLGSYDQTDDNEQVPAALAFLGAPAPRPPIRVRPAHRPPCG
jgi:hypothetical protein